MLLCVTHNADWFRDDFCEEVERELADAHEDRELQRAKDERTERSLR